MAKFSKETLPIHNGVLGYYPHMKKRNPIVRFEYWIDETLPALEKIMLRLAAFAIFAVGLITIVMLVLRHS